MFDKNFNNRYFITFEITLIHTVDIEGNKCYLNNIMENQNYRRRLLQVETSRKSFVKVLFQILELLSPLYYSNNI